MNRLVNQGHGESIVRITAPQLVVRVVSPIADSVPATRGRVLMAASAIRVNVSVSTDSLVTIVH